MLKTFDDIKTDVIVKMGISTTSAYYTDAILNDWIQQANRYASSYKKWPFSEGRVSTTFAAGSGENSDEWNFEGIKADSIRILLIGGKRLQKINFEDYLLFREYESSSTRRVFSDMGRTVFINPNADVSGTLTAWAQYQPVDIDVTDLTAETIFSNGDEEGNEAIVEKTLEFANTREQTPASLQKAAYHSSRAKDILDSLWKKVEDEQFNYHTDRVRGGMWERINIIDGGYNDELNKPNQFLW